MVGGVGTRQLVAARTSALPRRAAAWLLNTRYLDYVPAMGRRGGVACLSGRTAAYRRQVVLEKLDEFEGERFFGRRCIPGDDGRLTWLVLAAGYRTVHQSSAVAVSVFPDRWLPFLQQRLRWARNSYRCYLTAVAKRWLWRQPLVTQVTVLQVLLTPVTMGSSLFFLSGVSRRSAPLVALAYGAWIVIGRVIRGVSHLREHPDDLLIAPLMVVLIMTLAAPVKLIALFSMNRQGWLTRTELEPAGDEIREPARA